MLLVFHGSPKITFSIFIYFLLKNFNKKNYFIILYKNRSNYYYYLC